MNGLVLPDRCFPTTPLSLLPHRRRLQKLPLWIFSSLGLQCTALVDQELGKCPCQTFLSYGFSQCFIPLSALSGAGFPCLGRNVKRLEAAGLSRSFPAANTEGATAPGPTSSWPWHHICEEQRQAQAALSSHSLKIKRTPRPDN